MNRLKRFWFPSLLALVIGFGFRARSYAAPVESQENQGTGGTTGSTGEGSAGGTHETPPPSTGGTGGTTGGNGGGGGVVVEPPFQTEDPAFEAKENHDQNLVVSETPGSDVLDSAPGDQGLSEADEEILAEAHEWLLGAQALGQAAGRKDSQLTGEFPLMASLVNEFPSNDASLQAIATQYQLSLPNEADQEIQDLLSRLSVIINDGKYNTELLKGLVEELGEAKVHFQDALAGTQNGQLKTALQDNVLPTLQRYIDTSNAILSHA